MKQKLKLLLPLLALSAGLWACASANTSAFRTEQTFVSALYGAYQGWTNVLLGPIGSKITPDQSNQVKQVRLKAATSLLLVDKMRQDMATNSAAKPLYDAALITLGEDVTNFVSLINVFTPKQ